MIQVSYSPTARAPGRTMRCLLLTLLLSTIIIGVSSSSAVEQQRWLEDEEQAEEENDGNNNNYQDLSQFTMEQGTCFRMKIVADNDDDGNSYFYNGAYRAQYTRYISFNMCNSNNGQCSEYVTDLDTYLEETVAYVQNMCGACANQCRRRNSRRLNDSYGPANSYIVRRLEEEEQEENNNNNNGGGDVYVDCNTCVNECALLNSNKGNDGTDESGYLDCQADYEDGDVEYYTAPQCENGRVVIGHFYDDECTIKTSTLQDSGFSYNTFQTIANLQIDCSSSDACADLFDDAVLCSDGYADNDEDDAKLCKAAKAANRVQTYYKKPFYKKTPLIPIFLLLFVLGSALGFLSWTYYLRHKRHADVKVPMAALDGADLPPVS